MAVQILYEDNHILVVNKRVGTLVQGDKTGQRSLQQELKSYIKVRDRKPGNVYLGIVHRLDKPVSGVMIFAKTSKAAGRLSTLFRKKQVDKLYCALSGLREDRFNEDDSWQEVRVFLQRIKDKTVVCGPESSGAQESILVQKTVQYDKHLVHIIKLITGRKHQIRAQLSALGQPILGDVKYGGKSLDPAEGIRLHAFCCGFRHPVRDERIVIFSAPPDTFFDGMSVEEQNRLLEILQTECNEKRSDQ